jgi:hypothetical protein
VHILLIADSDNAHTTVPVTEIDGDQRVVVLPSTMENVGDRYGRQSEKPLVVAATPENRGPGAEPTETPSETTTPSETPSTPPPPVERATTLEITGDTAGDYSDPATLETTLTDTETGEPLADETVTFELTGSDRTDSWTVTTNDSGIASQTITLDRPPGSYLLEMDYDGRDGERAGDSKQQHFVIETEDTDLALAIAGKGSKMKLVGTLTDRDSGAGVEGRATEFFADGTSIGTASTDRNGTASVAPPAQYRNGHHDYEARFAGDDFYDASTGAQRT